RAWEPCSRCAPLVCSTGSEAHPTPSVTRRGMSSHDGFRRWGDCCRVNDAKGDFRTFERGNARERRRPMKWMRRAFATTTLIWLIGCSAGEATTGSETNPGVQPQGELKAIEQSDGNEAQPGAKGDDAEVQSVEEGLSSCNPPILWCVYPYYDIQPCHNAVICR